MALKSTVDLPFVTTVSEKPSGSTDEASKSPILDVLDDEQQTRKLLSSVRLKMAFMLFVGILLMGLCGLIFSLVSQVFDAVIPAVRNDLAWKAERGVA